MIKLKYDSLIHSEVVINSNSITVGGQDGDILWNLSDQNFIFLLEKSTDAHQLKQVQVVLCSKVPIINHYLILWLLYHI